MDGASAASADALLQAIVHGIDTIEAIRSCALAAGIVILWDHIITFDQEVNFLWNRERRWSTGRVLFVINRYYTLLAAVYNLYSLFTTNLTDKSCKQLYAWQAASGMISVTITQVTLMLRLYAMYDLSKKLLSVMAAAFVGCFTASLTIHVHAIQRIWATSHDLPFMPFCVPHDVPGTYWAVWVPILTFEVFLLALAVRRALTEDAADTAMREWTARVSPVTPRAWWRERAQVPWLRTKRFAGVLVRAQRLVDILIRDSLVYFLVVFAAYLANLLVWVLAPTDMIDLPVVFSEAFSCVMCSHMLLNMHTSLDSSRPDVDSHGMQGASIALQETSRGRSRMPGLDTLDLAVPQFIRVGPDDLERVSPASVKSGYFEERQDVF